MGFLTSLSRVIVVVLNIIFMLVSICLLGAGVVAYFAEDIPQIKTIDETLKEQLQKLVNSTGGSNDFIENFSIAEVLDGIGLPLIVMGCFLLPLTFFGCCGAWCKFRTLVVIYGLIVAGLLLGEIIVVTLMYAAPSTIQGLIKDRLKDTLVNFKGALGTDVTSLGWMFVMEQMKCCGVDGYTDFATYAPSWDRTPNDNETAIDAPLACCKSDPGISNMACAREATFDINTEGCFEVVWDTILGNPIYAFVGYAIGFMFQFLLILFSVMMYRDMKRKRDQNITKKKNKIHPRY